MSHYLCVARRLTIFILIAAGMAAALPLQAAVVVARSDEAMTHAARAIVTGTVVEVYSRFNEQGDIETVSRILVDETIKGSAAAGKIVDVVQFGGALDGRWQAQSGAPRYEVGARYAVFLDANAAGNWTTFDLALGQFRFVVRDGRQLLVRDTHEISGWMESGEPFHDTDRAAPQFLARVREAAKSGPAIKSLALQPAPQALDFDLRGTTQSATGAWAGAEGAMNDTVPAGNAGGNAKNLNDCESRVIPDDPNGDVSGVFAGSGVVATAFFGCGSPCGSCSEHPKNSEQYRAIDTADVVVNDGVSSSTISANNFLTTMVHEIGHTWGFRHSNQNADGGTCAPPLPCTGAAIMNSSVVGGLNGNLQDWDRDAANEVYGDGSREAAQTGTQYVGKFDIPFRRPNGMQWRIAAGAPCNPPGVPTINANPTTITVGQSSQLTASATGTSPTFAWFIGTLGDTSTPAGSGASITVFPTTTTSYWVRASACSQSANSATSVTVTVQQPVCSPTTSVSITGGPTSVTPGGSVSFSATANGSNPAPTFQWFTGNPGSGTQINGATQATLNANPTVTTTFYVEARNTCSTGPARSNPITVTVQPCTAPSGVSVLAAPGNIAIGGSTQLSVSSNGTGPFTIQWFQGNPPGTPIPSAANLSSFSATPTATTSFYAEVSNACGGPARSNVVTVTVAAQCTPPSNAVATGPASITSGQTANLSVAANGTGLTFQWFTGPPPNGSAIAGATAATLAAQPTATTTYYARVTGQCGTPIDSNALTVTVNAACTLPSITTQPANQSIIVGTKATLSVAAAGTGLTFQWFEGATGDTSKPQSGATSASFTTPALMKKTQYWVRVNGTCTGAQPVLSNTATVDVKAGRPRPVRR